MGAYYINQTEVISFANDPNEETVYQKVNKDGRIIYRPVEERPLPSDSRMGGLTNWDAVEAENRRNKRADLKRRAAQAAKRGRKE